MGHPGPPGFRVWLLYTIAVAIQSTEETKFQIEIGFRDLKVYKVCLDLKGCQGKRC